MKLILPCLFLICIAPVASHAGVQVQTPVVSVDTFPEDSWYGPGYYYGVWFDDEDDYWVWRRRYYYYPANRHYYNRYHRIYYR